MKKLSCLRNDFRSSRNRSGEFYHTTTTTAVWVLMRDTVCEDEDRLVDVTQRVDRPAAKRYALQHLKAFCELDGESCWGLSRNSPVVGMDHALRRGASLRTASTAGEAKLPHAVEALRRVVIPV